MRTRGKPGFWLGLLSGLLLTFPLVAIFYLGYRLAALAFPPFNLSDWKLAFCRVGFWRRA